jgi:hypothetical protein
MPTWMGGLTQSAFADWAMADLVNNGKSTVIQAFFVQER